MNALVLGGGGPVGASWESALLHELGSAGLPVAESDIVVGTSAGAVVGAWLTMRPQDLAALPERMRKRAAWHADRAANGAGHENLTRSMAEKPANGADATLNLAQAAIKAIPPISVDEAEELWRAASPGGLWPQSLWITAVNAITGMAHAWSADDDISLAAAIACSTAAPGAAPPVDVAGAVWVDGGVRSATNADLIIGAGEEESGDRPHRSPGKVLIVACSPAGDIAREESMLTERGYDVRVLISEPYYRKPADLLDPRFIDAAREAGTRQAREAATELTKWWTEQ